MVKWTTASIVLEGLPSSGTYPNIAEINTMIEMAEQLVHAIVRDNMLSTITFDTAKHGILRLAVTSLAQIKVIAENPDNFSNTIQTDMAIDIHWATFITAMETLMNQGTITYLKGL